MEQRFIKKKFIKNNFYGTFYKGKRLNKESVSEYKIPNYPNTIFITVIMEFYENGKLYIVKSNIDFTNPSFTLVKYYPGFPNFLFFKNGKLL